MSIFEAAMMVCFGVSWPFNIIKSYRSRSAKGKSLIFLCLIELGYICGIIHKYLYSNDFTIYLYVLNFIMVFIDFVLTIRNKKLDNAR